MDESLEKQLIDKFSFYTIHNENDEDYQTAFDCGSGWFNLILEMSEDIRDLIESKYDGNLDFTISYMKEKFGTLSIFTFGCPDDIDYIISQAEHDSGHICEQCGELGELREMHMWVYTRCDKCWNIIKEINKK